MAAPAHNVALPSTDVDAATAAAAADEDAPGPAISLPEDTGEGGKLSMIVQLVKKCFGVKDIAAMRLSLPASLLEPIPNLEYWHYLDRPDLFAAINDSEDPFDRMLAVLRFTFSKDLRHIRGKVCKPYNSVLGEHFRSHWDVLPVSYDADPSQPPVHHMYLTPEAAESSLSVASRTAALRLTRSETGSLKSAKSATGGAKSIAARSSAFGGLLSKGWSTPAVQSTATATAPSSTSTSTVESNLDAQLSRLSLAETDGQTAASSEPPEADDARAARVRVVYLTEQVSHHPPISAFHAACPARGVALAGVDQIAARVTSTAAVRIGPGHANKGVFVLLRGGHGAGERYQITHPVAQVNGILRGSFYVTVGEATIVTCAGGRGVGGKQLRAIIEYKEESWLGKPQFAVEGVVHTYTPGAPEHEEWTRVKHVPRERALAYLDGAWRHKVRWRRAGAAGGAAGGGREEWSTLLDLSTLHVVPKAVRALERQLPNESRRLWARVTAKLVGKEFGEATRHKHGIEQRQREEAAERKRRGVEFVPRYFEKDIESGVPILTPDGEAAIEEELKEDAAASYAPEDAHSPTLAGAAP